MATFVVSPKTHIDLKAQLMPLLHCALMPAKTEATGLVYRTPAAEVNSTMRQV